MGGLFSKKVGKKGILVLGLDNAGKTTTFQQLISGFDLSAEDIETAPTIGQNIDVTTYKNIKFNVVDMGGSSDVFIFWLLGWMFVRDFLVERKSRVDVCAGFLVERESRGGCLCGNRVLRGNRGVCVLCCFRVFFVPC
eukprot:TRINITY_DN3368_c0_g1_i2.p1 TRINITY_DN3368_c0_g1~~TRINITY_DN3368_c0_g1_i2.p1  ORF type:complete len:138 (-),score=14.56 TRINITY_DN3368_c0_g1_i2:33-446(-)